MRALIQRVSRARVIAGGQVVGAIQRGLLVFVGVAVGDTPEDVSWLAAKVAELRIFADRAGKFALSVADVGGAVLVVSQFTLCADVRKGRRPSFGAAAPPAAAAQRYEQCLQALRQRGLPVAAGKFGARMQVELVNDGPVTIWLDSRGR